jgi:hypothetical protein
MVEEVKARFPVGKTQWAKWSTMQRNAFNTLREQGKDFDTAVALANEMPEVFEELKPEVTVPEKTETVKPVQAAKKPAPKKKAK